VDKPYIEVVYHCRPRGGPNVSNVCCYSQRESPLISTRGSIASRELARYKVTWSMVAMATATTRNALIDGYTRERTKTWSLLAGRWEPLQSLLLVVKFGRGLA
jgi:hypothetical protein